jgi:hypothetical protein
VAGIPSITARTSLKLLCGLGAERHEWGIPSITARTSLKRRSVRVIADWCCQCIPSITARTSLKPADRAEFWLWRAQGNCRAAEDLLAPVYDWFTEGFDTPDLI